MTFKTRTGFGGGMLRCSVNRTHVSGSSCRARKRASANLRSCDCSCPHDVQRYRAVAELSMGRADEPMQMFGEVWALTRRRSKTFGSDQFMTQKSCAGRSILM